MVSWVGAMTSGHWRHVMYKYSDIAYVCVASDEIGISSNKINKAMAIM